LRSHPLSAFIREPENVRAGLISGEVDEALGVGKVLAGV